jgi:hypothetical protein
LSECLLWAWNGLNLLAAMFARSLRQQINAATLPEDIPTENIPNQFRADAVNPLAFGKERGEIMQQMILPEALATVRKRIQLIRDRKEFIGEQNTKAALIDPVLIALGWDLQEIDEVRREYRRKPQDNPVDYALFLNRTECLFIEAKSLEKDLNDRKWISQNLSYATVVGVR